MTERLMLLPSADSTKTRLVRVPADFSDVDALRHVTSLIASVQEGEAGYVWEDIRALLEDHGFAPVDFISGPALD